VTLDAALLGTMGYLSPEQLLGREVGPRSDLYAAGVVLFEMLAGKLPYEAASELGFRFAALTAARMCGGSVPRCPGGSPRW
jgi:serine/threonine protein kinase